MTEEHRADLLLAIARAQNAGRCSYIGGCVIAQLADIVDPSGATRRALEAHDTCGISDAGVHAPAALAPLHGYRTSLLSRVQRVWDQAGAVGGRPKPATPEQAEVARAKMREIVLAA